MIVAKQGEPSLIRLPAFRRRAAIDALLCVATALACSGALTSAVFTKPSTLKWALCIAVLCGIVVLVASPARISIWAGALILFSPLAGFKMTVSGYALSPYVAVVVLSLPIFFIRPRSDPANKRGFFSIGACFVAGLVPAIILSRQAPTWALTIILVLTITLTLKRAVFLEGDRALISILFGAVSSAVLQASLGIWEFVSQRPLNLYSSRGTVSSYGSDYFFGYEGKARAAAMYADPISLGNALAVTLPLSVAVALDRSLSLKVRLIASACSVCISVGLLCTYSRMSWEAAFAGVVVVALLAPRPWRGRSLAAVAGGVAVVAASASTLAGPGIIERFTSILNPTDSTVPTAEGDLARQRIWEAASTVFSEHPLVGVGIGNLNPILQSKLPGADASTFAHNTYLQLAAEVGLLGLVLLAVVIWKFAVSAISLGNGVQRGHNTYYATAGMVGAGIAIFLVWLTDYTIRYESIAVLMIAVLTLSTSKTCHLAVRRKNPEFRAA